MGRIKCYYSGCIVFDRVTGYGFRVTRCVLRVARYVVYPVPHPFNLCNPKSPIPNRKARNSSVQSIQFEIPNPKSPIPNRKARTSSVRSIQSEILGPDLFYTDCLKRLQLLRRSALVPFNRSRRARAGPNPKSQIERPATRTPIPLLAGAASSDAGGIWIWGFGKRRRQRRPGICACR